MRENDVQLGKPIVVYKDTKANIEALTSVVQGSYAYATDTDEPGWYDGASWHWIGAGRIVNTTRVTTTYTALVTDYMIYADTDGGAFTITLPAGVEGQYFRIANVGSSLNNLTIDGDGAETVRGALTQTLYDGDIIIVVYNATEGWL